LAQSFAGPDCYALSELYKRSLKQQLNFIIEKNPKYTWGGAEDPEHGLDCSGYLFLASKWAGIPGITRTTSKNMAFGLGGWTGFDLSELEEVDDCDLVFWTFSESRPHGHVGAFIDGKHLRVTHASSKHGVISQKLTDFLIRNLSKVRRLTIGD
jgi:hypothetical protein